MQDIVKKYIKRPLEISAIQYNGANIEDVREFVGRKLSAYNANENRLYITTLEGMRHVKRFDFVVRGIKGEYYPVRQDIFEDTYEELKPTPAVTKQEGAYICGECNQAFKPTAHPQVLMCACFNKGENDDM